MLYGSRGDVEPQARTILVPEPVQRSHRAVYGLLICVDLISDAKIVLRPCLVFFFLQGREEGAVKFTHQNDPFTRRAINHPSVSNFATHVKRRSMQVRTVLTAQQLMPALRRQSGFKYARIKFELWWNSLVVGATTPRSTPIERVCLRCDA